MGEGVRPAGTYKPLAEQREMLSPAEERGKRSPVSHTEWIVFDVIGLFPISVMAGVFLAG